MIKWCAYCQRYQGESPPYEDMRTSHGICPSCAKLGLDPPPGLEARMNDLTDLQHRFWRAGAEGRTDQLEMLAGEAVDQGVRPIDLIFGFAGPALHHVGHLWQTKKLTVADEHRFTAACESFLDIVLARYPSFFPKLFSVSPALLTCVQNNEHTLGVRFALIGLASIGVGAKTLLPGLAPDQLVAHAISGHHPVVGLSVAVAAQQRELDATLDAFLAAPNFYGKIIVCGTAVDYGHISIAGRTNAVTLVPRPIFSESERPFYT
jgi:methanogenic corrinoid protein MtbC1